MGHILISVIISYDGNKAFFYFRWFNDDTYIVVINVGRTYHVVNLTVFDLVFGQLEVEASSVLSSRTYR